MLMVGEVSAKEDCALLTAQTEAQKERIQKLFYVLGSRVALQRDVAHLQKTSMERDGQLANLEQVLAKCESQITDLNRAMEERAGQIGKLEQAVAGRETQIAEHDERIVNLKQIVTERSEEIGAYQREIEELDTLLKEARKQLEAARAENANLEQVIAERARQIAERDGRISAMTVSRSWQVTKPFRFIGRLLQTRKEREQEVQNPPFLARRWFAAIRQRLAQRIRRGKRGLGRP